MKLKYEGSYYAIVLLYAHYSRHYAIILPQILLPHHMLWEWPATDNFTNEFGQRKIVTTPWHTVPAK